jgi:hypothetical protein
VARGRGQCCCLTKVRHSVRGKTRYSREILCMQISVWARLQGVHGSARFQCLPFPKASSTIRSFRAPKSTESRLLTSQTQRSEAQQLRRGKKGTGHSRGREDLEQTDEGSRQHEPVNPRQEAQTICNLQQSELKAYVLRTRFSATNWNSIMSAIGLIDWQRGLDVLRLTSSASRASKTETADSWPLFNVRHEDT